VETNFPFISSTLDARKLGSGLPTDNLTPRGIILNLGNDSWACFDTDLLRISSMWFGKGVTAVSMAQISYHSEGTKALEGETILPQPIGTPLIANGIYPGWQKELSLIDPREPAPDPKEIGRGALSPALGRFNGIRFMKSGVQLEYDVFGSAVQERVESSLENGQPVLIRHFDLDRVPEQLWLLIGRRPTSSRMSVSLGPTSAKDSGGAQLVERADGLIAVRLRPSERPIRFSVQLAGVATASPAEPRAQGPPGPRWPEILTTRGTLSAATNAYVVDNIALPVENPWRRKVRLSSLDFFSDGRAAAVTFDGDVWLISGLAGDLQQVRWRRFASGLNEPQSLCIRDNEIFVFDRNGIWRLRDLNGDGEADLHELFSNAFAQTSETREYAQSMKLAPDGSFVIGKGGIQMSTLGKHNGCVMRVSPDGKSAEVLGYGLRSPYLGVHPKSGLITASDQQGNYVPTTPLQIIRDRQFYGFLSVLVPKEEYPAPIAEPLTWIPYPINASGANQVWLVGAKMGPLNDTLIHLGYYRPEIFAVRLNQRLPKLQAAVVSVTRDLAFSPMDGAVNPIDGQLYVTGFQIFGTTARQISGLARLRYTGAPSPFPREVIPMDSGVLLRFDVALDEKTAPDPANFSAERWNYRRTFNYGSPHFKTDGSKGQDLLVPSSAYLSKDHQSVFIGIAGMQPVMQMRIGWAVRTHDGQKLEQSAFFTPHQLAPFHPMSEGFDDLVVDLTPRSAAAAAPVPVSVEEGQRISELMGCVACHSTDGSTLGKVGPTWKGLFGAEVPLVGGKKVNADEAYLRESIREPNAKIVRGFEKSDTSMPSYEGVVSDAQVDALILYIKSLSF
jgi:glucose/arabinose dehydrogenase/mono/diheme cytochrome c family protein